MLFRQTDTAQIIFLHNSHNRHTCGTAIWASGAFWKRLSLFKCLTSKKTSAPHIGALKVQAKCHTHTLRDAILYNVENLRVLWFKNSYTFLKRTQIGQLYSKSPVFYLCLCWALCNTALHWTALHEDNFIDEFCPRYSKPTTNASSYNQELMKPVTSSCIKTNYLLFVKAS